MYKVGSKYIIITYNNIGYGITNYLYSGVKCYLTEVVSVSPKQFKPKFEPPLPDKNTRDYFKYIYSAEGLIEAHTRVKYMQENNDKFIKGMISKHLLSDYYLGALGIKNDPIVVDKIKSVLDEEFSLSKSCIGPFNTFLDSLEE